MKVATEHLDAMQEAIKPLDTQAARSTARALSYTNKSYRWWLFRTANKRVGYALSHADGGQGESMYTDAHIDTALRAIVAGLESQ